MRLRSICLLGLVCLLAAPPLAGVDLWVEGESAARSAVQRHPWYSKVQRDQLSGGDFLSHWHVAEDGSAGYRVQVPDAERYAFWLRANPTGTRLSYRIDGGAWRLVDFGSAIDRVNVADDGSVDLRYLAWVELPAVQLDAGEHRIAFRMHSENNHHGSIDCFLLTTTSFRPRGSRKPGEDGGDGLDLRGRWPFQPARDDFSDAALLDLRALNEDVAGEHGFVARSADGRDFVRGDGEPLRFWAMHSDLWNTGDLAALREHGRFLAKRGVNLVRWHGDMPDQDGALQDIDAEAREQLWRYVAAMKEAGIYLVLSPYYPHRVRLDDERRRRWGIDSEQGNLTGLVYFDERVQGAYKAWLRAMLQPVNPHTGIALKDEPAVAVLQIQNEDSLLFWTVSQIEGDELRRFQRAFGEWADERYGSLAAALDAWGEGVAGDAPNAGRLGLRHIWDMTQDGIAQKGAPSRRLQDQARFMTELMHDWHAEVARFLREEIGAEQLVNAGNWKTADPVRLNDLERWSYTANDVIAVNRYTGAAHFGEHRGWAIVAGDRYQPYSALRAPGTLPVALKQPAGYPIIITESNWVPPTLHQSEGPFLSAAYMGLNGVDALFWFSTGETQWRHPASANGYLPSIGKWTSATPPILGSFPAAAWLHRKAYLERGEVAVEEHRSLDDLWSLRVPVISEAGSFDPNRDAGDFASDSAIKQEVDRLAFLAGPVEVHYDSDPGKTRVHPRLDELIGDDRQQVTAITGQIHFDRAVGICRIDAPRAQGACGFLAEAGEQRCADLRIDSGNDYAAVLAVSLDERPLADSRQILVQSATHCRPSGWSERAQNWTEQQQRYEGFQILEFGSAPWQIVDNDSVITIANPALDEVVALDMNGLPRDDVIAIERVDGGVRFRLPPDVMYVIASSQ